MSSHSPDDAHDELTLEALTTVMIAPLTYGQLFSIFSQYTTYTSDSYTSFVKNVYY